MVARRRAEARKLGAPRGALVIRRGKDKTGAPLAGGALVAVPEPERAGTSRTAQAALDGARRDSSRNPPIERSSKRGVARGVRSTRVSSASA
jgi:hypothetical protein